MARQKTDATDTTPSVEIVTTEGNVGAAAPTPAQEAPKRRLTALQTAGRIEGLLDVLPAREQQRVLHWINDKYLPNQYPVDGSPDDPQDPQTDKRTVLSNPDSLDGKW